MSQLHEIDIQTLNFPAHWERVEDNHEGLASDHIADFGCDKLIDICNIYLGIGFLIENCQLGFPC